MNRVLELALEWWFADNTHDADEVLNVYDNFLSEAQRQRFDHYIERLERCGAGRVAAVINEIAHDNERLECSRETAGGADLLENVCDLVCEPVPARTQDAL